MTNNTDFYSQVEEGVKDRFRTLSSFFSKPEYVSSDDTVIAHGGNYFAIFRPGAFPLAPGGNQHEKNFIWRIRVDVYVKYLEYKTSWENFKAVRAAIINLLLPDPYLSEKGPIPEVPGVFSVSVSGDEDAQYFYFKDDPGARPNFIIQSLTVEVIQRVEFEF